MTRILIVDDSELIRQAATIALGAQGWTVETHADGESGVAAATADPPDAILLDVVMPGLDGPATLERLQADPRTAGVPVAFLTASVDDPDERARLAGLGVAGVLPKPFSLPELAGQVRAAFGWPA
jgi:DNA-binding response OmpR family regulator